MTPTREQIEAEFVGFIEFPTEDKRHVTSVSAKLFAEHIAAWAFAAGRDQGLREAKEVCEAERVADTGTEGDLAYNTAIGHCAAAIEQLRGK